MNPISHKPYPKQEPVKLMVLCHSPHFTRRVCDKSEGLCVNNQACCAVHTLLLLGPFEVKLLGGVFEWATKAC